MLRDDTSGGSRRAASTKVAKPATQVVLFLGNVVAGRGTDAGVSRIWRHVARWAYRDGAPTWRIAVRGSPTTVAALVCAAVLTACSSGGADDSAVGFDPDADGCQPWQADPTTGTSVDVGGDLVAVFDADGPDQGTNAGDGQAAIANADGQVWWSHGFGLSGEDDLPWPDRARRTVPLTEPAAPNEPTPWRMPDFVEAARTELDRPLVRQVLDCVGVDDPRPIEPYTSEQAAAARQAMDRWADVLADRGTEAAGLHPTWPPEPTSEPTSEPTAADDAGGQVVVADGVRDLNPPELVDVTVALLEAWLADDRDIAADRATADSIERLWDGLPPLRDVTVEVTGCSSSVSAGASWCEFATTDNAFGGTLSSVQDERWPMIGRVETYSNIDI